MVERTPILTYSIKNANTYDSLTRPKWPPHTKPIYLTVITTISQIQRIATFEEKLRFDLNDKIRPLRWPILSQRGDPLRRKGTTDNKGVVGNDKSSSHNNYGKILLCRPMGFTRGIPRVGPKAKVPSESKFGSRFFWALPTDIDLNVSVSR